MTMTELQREYELRYSDHPRHEYELVKRTLYSDGKEIGELEQFWVTDDDHLNALIDALTDGPVNTEADVTVPRGFA